MRTPEGVEVTGDDHRLGRLFHQFVQVAQLVLPMPVLDRQMHQEHADLFQFQLDDQPLDARVEVVKALAMHPRCGQEGIGLLAHDGQEVVYRRCAILAFICREVSQAACDEFGLVDHAGPHRAGVHLDQADDVCVLGAKKLRESGQHPPVGAQVARPRHGQVESWSGACGVTDVVDHQTQAQPLEWRDTRLVYRVLGYTDAHVAAKSHPRVRDAQLAGFGRLFPIVRISRKLPQFLLPHHEHTRQAAQPRVPPKSSVTTCAARSMQPKS